MERTSPEFLTILLLLALLAPACSPLPIPTPSTPQATIEITEIVDKTTLQPIAHNKISLRWGDAQGELLETKETGRIYCKSILSNLTQIEMT